VKDVVQDAGVSVTTVSYVLNQKPSKTISQETTQQVMDSVRKLGYVPNRAARSVWRRNRVQRVPNSLAEFMFGNSFYSEFLNAVKYTYERVSPVDFRD
jgi:LacI family transcriptional regulator